MFRNASWAAALALVGSAALAASADPAAAKPTSPALERLKTLAGEWVAAEDNAMVKKGDLVMRYAVTAAGTAVVETVFPGSPHEMVTVYHAEGDDLVLDHYCMAGNRPRMRAKGASGSRFEFSYEGGPGIDAKRDRHMHSAWLEIVGADEIRNQWNEHEGGKSVFVVQSHLVRKPL